MRLYQGAMISLLIFIYDLNCAATRLQNCPVATPRLAKGLSGNHTQILVIWMESRFDSRLDQLGLKGDDKEYGRLTLVELL